MQRYYADRENGPEFDNRLIRLVRSNPAIYDVSHPHYRRNPVRVAIWERIACELGAPSKFLQTKWKNIRYNYLQEVKCVEKGTTNANIRKRRFTEDLSFLQHTAQLYNMKNKNPSYNSSDNDSNGYLYSEADASNAFEVIEIDHSDDGYRPNDSYLRNQIKNETDKTDDDKDDDAQLLSIGPMTTGNANRKQCNKIMVPESKPEVTIEPKINNKTFGISDHSISSPIVAQATYSPQSYASEPSPPPLLMPMGSMINGQHKNSNNSSSNNGDEVTIEPIGKCSQHSQRLSTSALTTSPAEILHNAVARRRATAAPFPVLQPINDPIELYCLSLVDSLRAMPRSERERVKYEFANILKDAKYKDES